jgi:pyruvate dehydrogenase (quinone)
VALSWERALESTIPCVLEVMTDPDVPPLPPHISATQAKAYASAPYHRDLDAIGVITATFKEVWESLFPPEDKTRKDA